MKINKFIPWVLVVVVSVLLDSCKKQNQDFDPVSLEVSFPRLQLKHDLYYQIPPGDRSVEMDFSQPVDTATVPGNILFSDQAGPLDPQVDLLISGKKILLTLQPGFQFRPGWQYHLTITTGVRSSSGLNLSSDRRVEFRTTSVHPGLIPGVPPGDTNQRNSIAVISDIHMGLAKANELKYCWFGKNNEALEDLLDDLLNGNQIRQVVILGDLFDEWIVPYSISPFDLQNGITDNRSYFLGVAANPVNSPVFDKLRAIAVSGTMELIYVHGNHDMLLTREILEEIIPGITWKGDITGLGRYLPVPEIVMEHGHRYDFFNCPQPLVNAGHMLPPGYFISRLYAAGTMEHPGRVKQGMETTGSFEFLAAWEIAYLYTVVSLNMTLPDADSANILMGGIDGYQNPFSFHGVRDMYATNIEDYWPATQTGNGVVVPMGCCLLALWNGHSDLFLAAKMEYLEKPPAPVAYRIVTFGHTHEPMIQVYPAGKSYTGIYANSGSWVDANQSSHPVRTYLIITPGAWSGSTLDVVSLYQYNLETGTGNPGNQYVPVLIAEESI